MSVFDAVRNLRSFRSSTDRAVPRPVLGKMIEAARHAPSPGNVQSLEFIVVDSDQSKKVLADAAGDNRIKQVPTAVIIIGDIARMRREVGDADAYQACNSEASCAAHNMRLVGEEEGISSCWITGFDQVAVKNHFGIPEEKQPLGIVAACYSDDEIEQEKKFGIGDIVFYEHYKNQMRSQFDKLEWKGYHKNKTIVGKRWKGATSKLKRKLGNIL